MKKFILVLIILIISNGLIFTQNKNKTSSSKKIKPLKTYSVDLNKDSIIEKISLFGIPFEKNGEFYKTIYFTVKNEKIKKEIVVNLPKDNNSGYQPELSFYEFTGDKTLDIFYSAATGGSGGIYNYIVFSLQQNEFKPIFIGSKKYLNVKGELSDNYIAKFKVVEYNQLYQINLSDRKTVYEEAGFYKDSKLLKPCEIWVNDFSMMKAIDIDNDGIYELEGTQQIKGIANYDSIADLISIWKYSDNRWQIIKVEVKKTGN